MSVSVCPAPRRTAPTARHSAAAGCAARTTGRPDRARRLAQALVAFVAVATSLASPIAVAQQADTGENVVRRFVERAAGASGRVEVRLGQLDPRLQLAPCARIEPFLPPGTRLWGRTTIGVRCIEGANWSVALPVTVSVYGKALVAASPLAVGASPTPTDFRVEEVDLTRESAALVTETTQLEGHVLARGIAAGQVLRADHLKVPITVSVGDPVRIRVIGEGFSITGEGFALGPAGEGQLLRVRTESGKILAGTVRDRTIEVRM
jgi:flagella basal body P-ring formation protein FlgA